MASTTSEETRFIKQETPCPNYGCAAFQQQYALRDLQAGIITGAMAIPLSIGIAMMSN